MGSGAATVASLGHAHPRPGRASPRRTSLRGWAFTFLLFFLFFPRGMCPPSKTQSGLRPSTHATGWTWPPRRTPAAGTVPQCPSGCCRPPVSTVTPAACVDSRRLTVWSTPVRTPSGRGAGRQTGRRGRQAPTPPTPCLSRSLPPPPRSWKGPGGFGDSNACLSCTFPSRRRDSSGWEAGTDDRSFGLAVPSFVMLDFFTTPGFVDPEREFRASVMGTEFWQ